MPVLVEDRIIRVAHAVGDLRRFARGERVQVNRAKVVGQPRRVRQPLRVGRPDRLPIVSERIPVTLLADLHGLAALDVDVPDAHVRVDERDLFRVGRPSRRTVEAGLGHQYLDDIPDTGLRRDVQRILT